MKLFAKRNLIRLKNQSWGQDVTPWWYNSVTHPPTSRLRSRRPRSRTYEPSLLFPPVLCLLENSSTGLNVHGGDANGKQMQINFGSEFSFIKSLRSWDSPMAAFDFLFELITFHSIFTHSNVVYSGTFVSWRSPFLCPNICFLGEIQQFRVVSEA